MTTINLKELTLDQLKVFAYDCIGQKELAEANLRATNEEILLRMQQPPAPVVKKKN